MFIILSTSLLSTDAAFHCVTGPEVNLDVVFVLDVSLSITEENLADMIKLVSSVAAELQNDLEDRLRIGIVFYASRVYENEVFNLTSNQASINETLKGFERKWEYPRNIGTNTASGLVRMHQMFERQGSSGAKHVGLLFTDGVSDDPTATQKAANIVKESIILSAVGIGPLVNETELTELVSNKNLVLRVTDFKEPMLWETISNFICKAAKEETVSIGSQIDLPFHLYAVIDESKDVSKEDYNTSIKFLTNIMTGFKIGESAAKVWVINCGSQVKSGRNLNFEDYREETIFYAELRKLKKNTFNYDRNTDECLKFIQNNLFTDVEIPQIILVLQSGLSKNINQTATIAGNLKEFFGYDIVAVGAGDESFKWNAERKAMATNGTANFHVASYSDLNEIVDNVSFVIHQMANGTYNTGNQGTITDQVETVTASFDAVFAFDVSMRMSSLQWTSIIFTIRKMLEGFSLSNNYGRLGLILYNGERYLYFLSLTDSRNFMDVLQSIKLFSPPIDRTVEADNAIGLNALKAAFINSKRVGIRKVGVLITASQSQYSRLVETEARHLARMGIQLIVLGIPGSSAAELDALGINGNYVLTLEGNQIVSEENRAELRSYLAAAVQAGSDPVGAFPWRAKVDFAVLLHDDTGRPTTEIMSFLLELFARFVIGWEDALSPAVLVFGGDVDETASLMLGDAKTGQELRRYLIRTQIVPSGMRTISAVLTRMEQMFNNYGRPGAQRVALLLMDSLPNDLDMAMVILNRLRQNGIAVAAFGTGNEADEGVLKWMTYNEDLVTSVQAENLYLSGQMEAALASASFGELVPQSFEIITSEGSCSYPASIVILIDCSDSITSSVFENLKENIAELLAGFDLKTVKIGIICFGSTPLHSRGVNLGEYDQLTPIRAKLMEMDVDLSSAGSGTARSIVTAVEMIEELDIEENKRMIVIFTDGKSFNSTETKNEADKARSKGITIVAVGVDKSFRQELLFLAGSEDNVLELSATELEEKTKVEELFQLICQLIKPEEDNKGGATKGGCTSFMDVVIALDASTSVSSQDFAAMKGKVIQFASMLDISLTANAFGIITFSSTVHTNIFHLYQSVSFAAVAQAIVTQTKGNKAGTLTGKAISTAVKMLIEEGRTGTVKAIVVMTDGASTHSQDTLEQAAIARAFGFHLVGIGIGAASSSSPNTALQAELLNIATNEDSVIFVQNVAELSSVDLLRMICTDNFECIHKMDIVFIVVVADEAMLSEALALVDDIVSSFEVNSASTIFQPPKLHEAIDNAVDIILSTGAKTTVHHIMIISNENVPDFSAVVDSAMAARNAGMVLSVVDTSGETANYWDDVVSSSRFLFETLEIDGIAEIFFIKRSICQEPCGDGSERTSEGVCQPCPKGYYRNSYSTITCQICRPGRSTEGVGATSAVQCVAQKCDVPMDLVLVLDATQSLGTSNFGIMKVFLLNFIDFFHVGLGENQTRMAVSRIGEETTANDRTSLCDSDGAAKIKSDIIRMKGDALETNTGSALQAMIEIFGECGRDVQDIPRVGLVITDGKSVNGFDTTRQAARAKLEGIHTIAIGLGNDLHLREFQAIASSPNDVILMENVGDLLTTNVQVKVCEAARNYVPPDDQNVEPVEGACQVKLDIVVILDASSSINSSVFTMMKMLIYNFAKELDIGWNSIRMGIIAYSFEVHSEIFSLSDCTDLEVLREAIFQQRVEKDLSGTVTHLALARMIEMFRNERRQDAGSVALVLTYGLSSDTEETAIQARRAKREGIYVVAVGINDAFEAELRTIASGPESALQVDNINELTKDDLLELTCPLKFRCTAKMDIKFIWDLELLGTFLHAERFIALFKERFSESNMDNIFVDHVENGAAAVEEATATLKASGRLDAHWSIVMITDKTLAQETIDKFISAADTAKTEGISVALIDVLGQESDLASVPSNEDLYFQTKTFDDFWFSPVIMGSLCIDPCGSGTERAADGSCVECDIGSYRTAALSKLCQPCQPKQTTDSTGAESVNDCKNAVECPPGTKRSEDGLSCEECPEDTYQPEEQQDGCLYCPSSLTTRGQTRATSKSQCLDDCDIPLDIVFVVDASLSIGIAGLSAIKAFLIRTVTRFKTDDIDTRFALIPYADEVLPQVFPLEASMDRDAVTSAIYDLKLGEKAGTDTASALSVARSILLEQGRVNLINGFRPSHVIMTITDGKSDNLEDTSYEAEMIRKSYITSYGIGIGANVVKTEIRDIATNDDFAFFLNNFVSLINFDITELICEDTYICEEKIDLIFIHFSDNPPGSDANNLVDAFMTDFINSNILQTVFFTNELEMIDFLASITPFPTVTSDRTKLVIITTDADSGVTLVPAVTALKDTGAVVSVIYFGMGDSDSFEDVVSNSDFLFERENFGPFISFFERALCLQPCPSGSQRDSDGTCQLCPLGTYRDALESHLCTSCGFGETTPNEGATSEDKCFPTSCTDTQFLCMSDTTCIDMALLCDGADDCTDGADEQNCNNCQPGFRWEVSNMTCVECELSTYQPQENQTTCIPCPAGTITTTRGNDEKSDCEDPCDAGSQIMSVQNPICEKCPVGTYKDPSKSPFCLECPYRFTTVDSGSVSKDDCVPDCPPGKRWVADVETCVLCPHGEYQPDYFQSVCIPCPSGTTTLYMGAESEVDCTVPCPDGQEFVGDKCNLCKKNTFRSGDEPLCVNCPAKHITLTEGAKLESDCIPKCMAGKRWNPSNNRCVKCEKGSYQPAKYQRSCIPCPTWQTTLTKGSNNMDQCVDKCEGGFFASGDECIACPKDTFREKHVNPSCVDCAFNFVTENIASDHPNLCLPGCTAGQMWDPVSEMCMDCPMGFYQPNAFQIECIKCEDGLTTLSTMSTQPSDCIELECGRGEWRCTEGQQCILQSQRCDMQFDCLDKSDEWDQLCVPCDAGQRWDSRRCVACERGTFQPKKFQRMCYPCPEGTTTESTGATEKEQCIDPCKSGYQLDRNRRRCESCPRDTYKDKEQSAVCKPCPQGYTTRAIRAPEIDCCLPEPCSTATDIIIMVDMSRDITTEEFNAIEYLIMEIVRRLDIGLSRTRVGIIQYARGADVIISPKRSTSERRILSEVEDELRKSSRYRDVNTPLVLNLMREMFDDCRRPGVPQHAILIQQSPVDNVAETIAAADLAKAENILVTAIGIGDDVTEEELLSIASSPFKCFLFETKPSGFATDRVVFELCRAEDCDKQALPGIIDSFFKIEGEKQVKMTCPDEEIFVQSICSCAEDSSRKKREACTHTFDEDITFDTTQRTNNNNIQIGILKNNSVHKRQDQKSFGLLTTTTVSRNQPLVLQLTFKDEEICTQPRILSTINLDIDRKPIAVHITLLSTSYVNVIMTEENQTTFMQFPYKRNQTTKLELLMDRFAVSGHTSDSFRIANPLPHCLSSDTQGYMPDMSTQNMTNSGENKWASFSGTINLKLFSGCSSYFGKSWNQAKNAFVNNFSIENA